MIGTAKSILAWAAGRPSYVLLTAGARRFAAAEPHRFARAWIGLMLLSLAWGLASAALWGAAWAIFGYYNNMPLMSTALVAGAALLWPYRQAALAMAEAAAGEDAGAVGLVAGAVVVFLVLAMLGLRSWNPDWPTSLPAAWRWLRPPPTYRALLLGPLWGGWAMLIVPQFCRANERTEPAVAAFARGCGPFVAAGCMGAVAAATILYFNFLPWWQLSISAAPILAAIACGIVLCATSGGLNRRALLAANLVTQMVFLAAYLANR